MKLFTPHFIIFVLIVPSIKLVNCQFSGPKNKRQKYCITKGLPLPYYPCLKKNYNLEEKSCNGRRTQKIDECLKCVERNKTIPFPYPIFVPVCDTECPSEKIWCEPQQQCIDKNQGCDCGPGNTYCTYIDKDKLEHQIVNGQGKDVHVHGTTEKYRCFSSKELEKRKNNNEYEICPDGSCKETYMNCSESSRTVTPDPRIVNHSNDAAHDSSNNGTWDASVNLTTTEVVDGSSPTTTGLSVGLSLGLLLLLGIAWTAAGVYCCRLKKKHEETMWVDDNPDYGEVEDYDEATVVTDVNDYYGKDDDEEEETALVDINDDYGRLTVSVGSREARLELIQEVSSDDEKENQRDSVFYDKVSQNSQESDYD